MPEQIKKNILVQDLFGKVPGIWPKLYCLWAMVSIALALAVAGFNAESQTRLAVLALLLLQLVGLRFWTKLLPRLAPKARFLVLGMSLAAVVEGMHMISTPVFLSLRIGKGTSWLQGLSFYGLDLLLTLPAYFVIFSTIWFFIRRYDYAPWHYLLIMGLAQTLGDGGIFYFVSAPGMLLFLPYPMSNYHAINLLPFLAVRAQLPSPTRNNAKAGSWLAIPGVIAAYLICGAVIQLVGRYLGLAPH